jgi:hypothetical protein
LPRCGPDKKLRFEKQIKTPDPFHFLLFEVLHGPSNSLVTFRMIFSGYFNLTQKDTKTSEARHVYFNEEVKAILERLGKVQSISHSLVFTYREKPA